MHAFREQALLLGRRKSLVGILAAGGAAPVDRPTVVILNSGIVHRVGANRLSVALARALAARGHPVLRFDLSGIGDSEPCPEAISPLDSSLADIRDVLDWLESARGARRIVLAGLCSGADQALLAARADRRVVGAVLLDPSLPPTRRHALYHYRRRLLRAESWLNLVRGRNPIWRALRRRRAADASSTRSDLLAQPWVRTYLERAYADALARDVRFLAVLTGERSYYREHFVDAFPGVAFGDRLHVEHLERSDHMFTAPADAAHLVDLVLDWMSKAPFPAGAGEETGQGGSVDFAC